MIATSLDRIIINFADNQDSHKILDEFEFRPDRNIHFGVTCSWVAKKPIFGLVRSIVPSILIGSSSDLQVTGAAINSQMSWNFDAIRLQSYLPLRAEKAHSWPCPINSDFIFDRMFFKLAGYRDSYKILDKFDFGPDRTIFFGVTCSWEMKNFPIDL